VRTLDTRAAIVAEARDRAIRHTLVRDRHLWELQRIVRRAASATAFEDLVALTLVPRHRVLRSALEGDLRTPMRGPRPLVWRSVIRRRARASRPTSMLVLEPATLRTTHEVPGSVDVALASASSPARLPPAVSLAFVQPPPATSSSPATATTVPRSEPSSAATRPVATPAIDYDMVTRKVYDKIQQRVAIERERRGY
jgi:hypothetical protein